MFDEVDPMFGRGILNVNSNMTSRSEEENESLHQTGNCKVTWTENKKINNCWIWHKYSISAASVENATSSQLPEVRRLTKNVTNCFEIWKCFISSSIIELMVDCTNKDDIEMTELIRLLYLPGIYHESWLHLEKLWRFDDIGTREKRKKDEPFGSDQKYFCGV